MHAIPPPGPISGPIPRLDTLHRIEVVLRRAAHDGEGPLRLAEIMRRLPTKSIRHSTVRACVDELVRLRVAHEDPGSGVTWSTHAGVAGKPVTDTAPVGAAPGLDTGPRAMRARLHKRYRLARELRDVPPGQTIEMGLQLMTLGRALASGVGHD